MVRSGRLLSFDDYLFHACQRLHNFGGSVDVSLKQAAGTDLFVLEGRVSFAGDEPLEFEAFELIEKTPAGTAHRSKYRYQCRWHGQVMLRYDREPLRHPEMPEHKHVAGQPRVSSGPVTPKDVVAEMWQELERLKQREAQREAEKRREEKKRSA